MEGVKRGNEGIEERGLWVASSGPFYVLVSRARTGAIAAVSVAGVGGSMCDVRG